MSNKKTLTKLLEVAENDWRKAQLELTEIKKNRFITVAYGLPDQLLVVDTKKKISFGPYYPEVAQAWIDRLNKSVSVHD